MGHTSEMSFKATPTPSTRWVIAFFVLFLKSEAVPYTPDNPLPPCPQSAEQGYRLPTHTIPLAYDIYMHPNLDTYEFSGHVDITLETSEENLTTLQVHSKKLNITSVELFDSSTTSINVESVCSNTTFNLLVITVPKNTPLESGIYNLKFVFNGDLATDNAGFYLSEYTHEETKRYLATTQFQSTDARKAFPCLDEPGFKANFTVTLVRPSDNFVALSNMNQLEEIPDSPENGLTTVTFNTSVPMVTYLVSFIVCDFKNKTTKVNDAFNISVYASPHQIDYTDYALEAGKNITSFFIDYFDMEYPLPKLDMIAVPDFRAGAMENWGLITYREAYLLNNPYTTASSNLQRIAVVVAHELAHMWFGNLMTLEWWDDLWLNEGFASYMEHKGTDHIHPEWNMMDQFLTEHLHSVMEMDAALSSHPIVQHVETQFEIAELFDTITYSKGGSVIRMLENFMGEKKFQQGLQSFLKKFSYDNAITSDLWTHLQEVSDPSINISYIMDTWTRQEGLPVLSVKKTETGYNVTQQRFFADSESIESVESYKWEVPVTYLTSSDSTPQLEWLHTDRNSLEVAVPLDVQWVKFNSKQFGYYRVNYEESHWLKLQNLLEDNWQALEPADKASLLDDAFSLANAGYLNYKIALDMTYYLGNEEHYLPWTTAARKLQALSNGLQSTDSHSKLAEYILSIVSPVYDKLQWNDDTTEEHLKRLLRVVVVDLACSSGHKECLAKAKELFIDWLTSGRMINNNLRSLAYKYGMNSVGNETLWNNMWGQYQTVTDAQEKLKMLQGLAWTKNGTLLSRYIELVKDPNNVKDQDFFTVLRYIAANPVGNSIVWDFIRTEWNYLEGRFTLDNRYLGLLIPQVTGAFATENKLQELLEFFADNPDAGAGAMARQQAEEKIKNNIKWLQKHSLHIANWLTTNWTTDYRLPRDVMPTMYNVYLHPKISEGTFSGSVSIELDVTEQRSFIVVHAADLNITSTVFKNESGQELPIHSFQYKENEFQVIQFNGETIDPGKYSVHFEFNGILTDRIVSIYRSEYIDEAGNKRHIVTTQFQATDARRAFPCFDEPNIKANFTISLVKPTEGFIALSNMDISGHEDNVPSSGLTTVRYHPSVKMSTYLVCFIVCDFGNTNATFKDDRPFRVFASQHQVNYTQYALETGVGIIDYYIDYFNIDYPLPKLDMIAIPDFVAGAMENWGLITYRESNLLYDKAISSSASQQRAAAVIGHELAHMWFGNLMTLDWWEDLWLNEGFASYMEYKGVNHVHEDWKMMDQFLTEDLHKVLELDASLSSHPILQPVSHPDEISELFDTISYSKGASVIRMLENFIGEEKFQQGLKNFLTKFSYKNAVTQDLWDSLQEEVGTSPNIMQIMDTWTKQMGFPVVHVEKTPRGFVMSQERFLADPDATSNPSEESPYGYRWEIPVTFVNKSSPQTSQLIWIGQNNQPVLIESTDPWIKVNFGQVGFFRVNYSLPLWEMLISELKGNPTQRSNVLGQSDRASLLDDVFSLAEAKKLNFHVALNLTEYLTLETEYVPWMTAATKFKSIYSRLHETTTHPMITDYVQKLVSPMFDDLTFEENDNDNHLRKRLRVVIVDLACTIGHRGCLASAEEQFDKWITAGQKPKPNLRSFVYNYGMQTVDNNTWHQVWDKYKTETNAQERSDLMQGLANTRSTTILRRYIELAYDPNNVKTQDFFSVLQYISANPNGTELVWTFVKDEWENLVERYTLNDRYLGRLIPQITSTFSTQEKLDDMLQFFEKYPNAGAGVTARKQAIEKVQNNIKWKVNHHDAIHEWLEKEAYEPPTTSTVNPSTSSEGPSNTTTTSSGGPSDTTTTSGGPSSSTTTSEEPSGPTTTSSGGPSNTTTTSSGGPSDTTTTSGGPSSSTTTSEEPSGPTTTSSEGPSNTTTTSSGGPSDTTTTSGGPSSSTTTSEEPSGPTTTSSGGPSDSSASEVTSDATTPSTGTTSSSPPCCKQQTLVVTILLGIVTSFACYSVAK